MAICAAQGHAGCHGKVWRLRVMSRASENTWGQGIRKNLAKGERTRWKGKNKVQHCWRLVVAEYSNVLQPERAGSAV